MASATDTTFAVPTLTNAVADWIAAGIISGRWAAGEHLRETEVCEELGVSRAPVREAIRILHEKGLVRHVPRIGAVVADFSTKTVLDVYEMRAVIESWICRESVPKLTGEDVARLTGLLEEMRDAESTHDHDRFFDLGWRFRQTLHSGSTNSMALDLVDQLRSRLHSLPQVLRSDEKHVGDTIQAYSEMLDAASRGDGEAVAAVVFAFMKNVGAYVCTRYTAASKQFSQPMRTDHS